jgi:hypothetical protein
MSRATSSGPSPEVISLLLDWDADLFEISNGFSALGHSCSSGKTEIVKILLQRGAGSMEQILQATEKGTPFGLYGEGTRKLR